MAVSLGSRSQALSTVLWSLARVDYSPGDEFLASAEGSATFHAVLLRTEPGRKAETTQLKSYPVPSMTTQAAMSDLP